MKSAAALCETASSKGTSGRSSTGPRPLTERREMINVRLGFEGLPAEIVVYGSENDIEDDT